VTVADLQSLPFSRATDLSSLLREVDALVGAGKKPILLAGGTDFMVEQEMRKPFASLDAETLPPVIDVSRTPELRGISLAGDVLRVGAATTYLEMERSGEVRDRAPLVARMSKDVGAVTIQARGTFGGNLATASPAADGVAALAAYDAVIVVASVRGERRIAMADLQTGYKTSTRADDEVIVAVELPLPKRGSAWYWRKVGTRRAQAISKVALGAIAEIDAGQVVRCGLGMASVAPVTALLPRTRQLLLSTKLAAISGEALDKAVDADVTPIDDVRSTRGYRSHVARAVVRDFARSIGAKV
jgi:CO/xanthine dehydrogenase FAD-binding subunit